ncbi:3-oxoacyl-ACP synthase III family protein [Mangrovihabitans endophyticus]|uniref:3-oxoacyl-[acyl-carrier-protein] synthase 3 n=1 Tax=Mangrovihabitans endophyticus TaxID=1751298 RepID=A0A8J3BXB0_9ACTN|nr:ketoacyl-ACP synthase III [Mangrovihabitans endophyticus]GGK78970.1 3-oxoacyl-[acyl-carrier-protein] synthase 3 [Mangrovihabitans endophyticus]
MLGIVGTGSHLPRTEVDNATVAERTGVTPEWIVHKTGIRRRWYAGPDEATSDLAVHAARAALADGGVSAERLRLIVVATSTPDHPQPPTASLVQRALGAYGAGALDVNAVCSGFVFALATAAGLLGDDEYGLVIGADVYSRIIDRGDRRVASLFGDGAGAVLLGPVPSDRGLLGWDLRTFGALSDLVCVDAGGSRTPVTPQTTAAGRHLFRMDGRGVADFVRAELPPAIKRVLASTGVAPEQVDHVVPHQANAVLLTSVAESLDLPRARLQLTADEHGNTGAASIPLALDTAERSGAFAGDDLILLTGFGGGMSVGSVLLRWHPTRKAYL